MHRSCILHLCSWQIMTNFKRMMWREWHLNMILGSCLLGRGHVFLRQITETLWALKHLLDLLLLAHPRLFLLHLEIILLFIDEVIYEIYHGVYTMIHIKLGLSMQLVFEFGLLLQLLDVAAQVLHLLRQIFFISLKLLKLKLQLRILAFEIRRFL